MHARSLPRRIRRVEAKEVAQQLDRVGDRAHSSGERLEQPVDLRVGVVVDEARAHRAAGLLEPQPAQHLERVVVARPDGDALLAEAPSDLVGRDAVDREHEGRHAAIHRLPAVQRRAGRQAREEPLAERALVRLDRLPPDRLDVLDGRDEAGEQLERLRPVSKRWPSGSFA